MNTREKHDGSFTILSRVGNRFFFSSPILCFLYATHTHCTSHRVSLVTKE